jgi:Gas vesicle synthesis protein GvpL/GvpF
MPILLYCVSNRATDLPESLTGVAGLPVTRVELFEFAAFISRASDPAIWLQSPLRTAAVEFHHVCNQIFKSAAIIPFRFPTTFETEGALAEHLKEQSARYTAVLEKFRDLVQMEIQISRTNSAALPESGADYLRGRQNTFRTAEHFSCELKKILAGIVSQWRQHEVKEGIRSFALLERNALPQFNAAMQASAVPEGTKVRVSGPWPVSEFIEQG